MSRSAKVQEQGRKLAEVWCSRLFAQLCGFSMFLADAFGRLRVLCPGGRLWSAAHGNRYLVFSVGEPSEIADLFLFHQTGAFDERLREDLTVFDAEPLETYRVFLPAG